MASSKNDNWIRRFVVSDPRKHKKGFTIYKVTSIVFPKASPEAVTRVVVWKRYNDFKKLHHELQFKHKKLYLQDKFPSFVKAKFFGRFEEEVIEERRMCATVLLEFIGDHPPLFTSNTFVKFFESGYTVEEENKPSSEVQTAVAIENGIVSDNSTIRTDCLVPTPCELKPTNNNATRVETEGPLLKLGGTWQNPQVPDSISLSSHSSDEHTTFTDTDSALSGVSTPLQSSDLQFFDPLQQSPSKQSSPNISEKSGSTLQSEVNNSWLLSVSLTSTTEAENIVKLPEPCQEDQVKKTSRVSEESGSFSHSSSTSSVKESNKHGNVELPAEMFLSVRTEDFTGTSCLGSGQKFDGAFLTPPTTPTIATSETLNCGPGVNYIFEAAYHVGQAQQYEANGGFEAAFAFYKAGIACLLSGVQDDTDTKRKQVVREKTAKYLLQAEKLYNQHLTSKTSYSFNWNASVSSQLCRPLSELKTYKVLGIIHKVMLVLNVIEDQCYIMKVLHKSPCPINSNKNSIMPQNVPYMVVMHRYFETDSAVFLVLHHASGGKLWDHVSSYFQSLPPTPVHVATKENVYFGKKLISEQDKNTIPSSPSVSSVLKASVEDCLDNSASDSISSLDHSYLELIRDYTSSIMQPKLEFDQKKSDFKEDHKYKSDGKSLNILGERTVDNIGPHSSLVSGNTSCPETKIEVLSTPERMGGGSSLLPDSVDVCNHRQITFETSDPTPDLLKTNNYSFSWKNLESLDTTDLVENAQKLIQSVSETLLRSETKKNNVESEHLTKGLLKYNSAMNVSELKKDAFCNLDSKSSNLAPDAARQLYLCDKNIRYINYDESRNLVGEVKTPVTKTVIRCKSEDMPTIGVTKTRERRRSTTRRCSVTSRPSLERRYSSDDLFEGRARASSGSLDRRHQWARLHSVFDRPKPRLPEATIHQWAAELLVCLDSLHRWGIICRDLRPDNILLGEKGHLVLTYMCNWVGVDSLVDDEATTWLYAAPEVNNIFQLTPSADWWSFGALVFELLTGKSLLSCHPGGIYNHTILNIPDFVSPEAHSLLTELLRYNPQERLGSGVNGTDDLKAHPFFKSIDWQTVLDIGTSS